MYVCKKYWVKGSKSRTSVGTREISRRPVQRQRGGRVFRSILFKNQVASFLTAFVLCLFQYFFWDFLASLGTNPWSFKILSNIGIKAHYVGLSLGIIKLDNIVYLIGLIIIINMFGINQIKKEQFK